MGELFAFIDSHRWLLFIPVAIIFYGFAIALESEEKRTAPLQGRGIFGRPPKR